MTATGFAYIWERAEPVEYRGGIDRPRSLSAATRMNVVRLVVSGYTDAAIANRLGVSIRTVSKYLHEVSEELGTRSRAQLGYAVCASGRLNRQTQHNDEEVPADTQ